MIGKYEQPGTFKNFNFSNHIEYYHNKHAWKTREIFNEYLLSWDNQLYVKRRKICLMLDNCPAHKLNVKLRCIEIFFLPPNTTSFLQPLDAGIIKCYKSYFNYEKLNDVFEDVELGISAEESFKRVDMKKVVLYTKIAWDKISETTIQNCFSHCKWSDDNNALNIKEEGLNEIESAYSEKIKILDITDSISLSEYSTFGYDHKDILLDEIESTEEVEKGIKEEIQEPEAKLAELKQNSH